MSRRWLAVAAAPVAAAAAFALLVLTAVAGSSGGAPPTAPGGAVDGIPGPALDAYNRAAERLPAVVPGCQGMRWSIVAAVGQIESGHAAGREIAADGQVSPPILGPLLDGRGAGGNHTAVADTDRGRYDGNSRHDRAVGPMQFLPATWQRYRQDGNDDGATDPQNLYDAALTAAAYLCGTPPTDLDDPEQLSAALYRYNHSDLYVRDVLGWIETYDGYARQGQLPPGSPAGAQLVAAAKRWLGTPYAWGGGNASGPTRGFGRGAGTVGFDCSGLTVYAAAQIGIRLPRTSAEQFRVGTRIPRSAGLAALQVGDLVFFAVDPATGTGIHHVAIWAGAGQVVHAPRTGDVVKVSRMWLSEYAGAVRITS